MYGRNNFDCWVFFMLLVCCRKVRQRSLGRSQLLMVYLGPVDYCWAKLVL
jgi:hypothetical protein